MPQLFYEQPELIRSVDHDVITAIPLWINRWGKVLLFVVLFILLGLSSFIHYPDIIRTSIKIESPNVPKPVVTKLSGKLVKLLVSDNQFVKKGQALGFMQSTAKHEVVIRLLRNLQRLQTSLLDETGDQKINFKVSEEFDLGELQFGYEIFFQEYTNYLASINHGFYIQKNVYLKKNLLTTNDQIKQLALQKSIQLRDYMLAEKEFEIHKKLKDENVESLSEFRQEESKYLSKKAPVIQTEGAILEATSSYTAKEKEIGELKNQIDQAKVKFLQALNTLISQVTDWKSKYVLSASDSGKIIFSGVVQENQFINQSEEVFYVNPGNGKFFGMMSIPQNNMGKVMIGQEVLIKLKSYPFEEYGMIRGNISYLAALPSKDSTFFGKVNFGPAGVKRSIQIKQGMIADAEIITEDMTILKRVFLNFDRIISTNEK